MRKEATPDRSLLQNFTAEESHCNGVALCFFIFPFREKKFEILITIDFHFEKESCIKMGSDKYSSQKGRMLVINFYLFNIDFILLVY